jgi:hypothetical protein
LCCARNHELLVMRISVVPSDASQILNLEVRSNELVGFVLRDTLTLYKVQNVKFLVQMNASHFKILH